MPNYCCKGPCRMLKYLLVCLVSWNCPTLSWALEYSDCTGSYGIDLSATIALMKSKVTPENEVEINEIIKGLEQEKDKVGYVTFLFNAKTIDFKMDDGTNNIDKHVATITAVATNSEGAVEISASSLGTSGGSSGSGDETNLTLSRHDKSLVLESDKMTFVLQKK